MTDDVMVSTRKRLRAFNGRYPEICDRFDLQYSWLTKVASGERGKRPSFDMLSRLLRALDALEAEAAVRESVQSQSLQ